MEQFEFHLLTQQPFVQIEPLISELTLNSSPSTSRITKLQKHEPGSKTAGDFIHDYIEEIYIVEGSLTDTNLGKTFEKGCYAYRKPGMRHGPFESREGCLMFIVCLPAEEAGKVE